MNKIKYFVLPVFFLNGSNSIYSRICGESCKSKITDKKKEEEITRFKDIIVGSIYYNYNDKKIKKREDVKLDENKCNDKKLIEKIEESGSEIQFFTKNEDPEKKTPYKYDSPVNGKIKLGREYNFEEVYFYIKDSKCENLYIWCKGIDKKFGISANNKATYLYYESMGNREIKTNKNLRYDADGIVKCGIVFVTKNKAKMTFYEAE